MATERTFIIFKPDAVQRGIVGEVLTRFEKVGLKVVAMKMQQPTKEHYYKHYETIGKMISRRGQEAFDVTLELMLDGPVIATILEGVDATSLVRKMVGETEPKSASPGTIRGDYAHMSFGHADEAKIGIPNIVHASGDAEEAKQEIALWFSNEEIYTEYSITSEKFVI